ncbi:MAG: ThuA domain-containing protein [Armatimonadota bacterium]
MGDTFQTTEKIKTAVVTGRHPYEVPGFHDALASIPEIACYVQHMEDFAADAAGVREQYDVLVFYNFHQATPTDEGEWWERGMKTSLERLGETKQGILVLHHAVLAFLEWPFWAELVGIADRKFDFHIGETLTIEVADPDHPITQGLTSWETVDETYVTNEPGEGSEVLLTTDHPKSMRSIGWTRRHGQARVFCLQSGHDNRAYANPSFRTVLSRGIQWLAGRL